MTGLELALICVALLGPWAIVTGYLIRRETRPRHPLVARRVMVQLQDGSAVAGLLIRTVGGFLVLENARLYENGGEVPVDGSAWLPTDQVRWIQHGGEA